MIKENKIEILVGVIGLFFFLIGLLSIHESELKWMLLSYLGVNTSIIIYLYVKFSSIDSHRESTNNKIDISLNSIRTEIITDHYNIINNLI